MIITVQGFTDHIPDIASLFRSFLTWKIFIIFQGKGSYYFEPTHLQYIPLCEEMLDIIQVQIAEAAGVLTTFGRGITTVTFHFKQV